MLSVIVPARGDGPQTRDCIKSALFSVNKLGLKCQVILIDDLSDPADGILDVFREMRELGKEWHDFTIVRTAKHEHYTGVFSIGLSLVAREHAFFLSNDMLITPSFFRAVLGVSALSSEIGIVRGTSPHTDSFPEYQIKAPTVSTYPDVEAFSESIFEEHGFAFEENGYLSGDAILIRRPVIDAIGVLDTRFFGYFGDVDYGMRTQLAKFKLVCAKGAWLHHSGAGHIFSDAAKSNTGVDVLMKKRMELVQRGYKALIRKWGPDIPVVYNVDETPKLLPAIAAKNSWRVPLKFELPAAALAELQRH